MDINTGIMDRAAEFWIDSLLLPVTPDTLNIKNSNQNESGSLVDGNPYTIPKLDKAETLDISFMMPIYMDKYKNESWLFESEITSFLNFRERLRSIKNERREIIITIIYSDGTSINGRYLLDDWSVSQDATKGSDYYISMTCTESYPPVNQEVDVDLRNTLVRHGLRDARRVS